MAIELERQFDEAMLTIYNRAKEESGYNATRFLSMLAEHGGLQTAKILLHTPTVSDGYTALWELGRLDLTMEAMILQPGWRPLFSPTELLVAVQRLRQYGYSGQLPELGSQ